MVEEPSDNFPFRANPEQLDSDEIGFACEESETFCTVIRGLNDDF